MKKYRCKICGHIVELDGDMPSNYVCPVFVVGADQFELIEG